VLDDLALRPASALECGDMVVVGPTGNRARLPCLAGTTYPATVLAAPRTSFDATLRDAALEYGAEELHGVVNGVSEASVLCTDGRRVDADFLVGADGANSVVASSSGLHRRRPPLRAFAVRGYVPARVAEPHILFWEPEHRRAFPGYGWIFPGPDGLANVGLGAGATASSRPAREMDAFLGHASDMGVLESRARPDRIIGGWLSMGTTSPASGRTLVVGDAAGLVNPLQGEGISEALSSGRAAAEAILAGGDAAAIYCRWVASTYGRFQSAAALLHRTFLTRPRATSALSRALVTAGRVPAIAGAWSVFWNDLLDGAQPGRERILAAIALSLLTRR
jgi:flavin-dependent dehydrogenase